MNMPDNSIQADGKLTISSINREDSGKYQCTATNAIKDTRKYLDVDVLYPVNIIYIQYANTTFLTNELSRFTCLPDGNPMEYSFGTWQHKSLDGTFIRDFNEGIIETDNSSILTIPRESSENRYQDSGVYVCSANNTVEDSKGRKEFNKSVVFYVEAPPVILDSPNCCKAQLDKTKNISFPVYSIPDIQTVKWFRKVEGSFQEIKSDQFVKTLKEETIVINFHNVSISTEGHVADLYFTISHEENFTDYIIQITNSKGITNLSFTLEAAGPPEVPIKLHYTKSVNAITIMWTAQFNGGDKQTFYIEYAERPSTFIYSGQVRQDNESDLYFRHTVQNLQPGTQYFFQIKANNSIGESDYAYINASTDVVQIVEPPGISAAVIGGSVGASSAIVLFAVVIVTVLFIRKRNQINKPKKADQVRLSRYSDDPVEYDEHGLIKNPIYVSGGDVIDEVREGDGRKPNIVYQSVDAVAQVKNDMKENVNSSRSASSAIYTQVNKPKPGPSGVAQIYAEVKKSKKPKAELPVEAVYSEVHKPSKGKAKELKEGQSKPEKGKKAENKKGGKNVPKKKGNKDDVYENMENKAFRNTENIDEIDVPPVLPKKPQIPSRKKNKDGLVYLDVEFKSLPSENGNRRPVIHGIENRIAYAEVNFSARADPLPKEAKNEMTHEAAAEN